MSLLRGESLRVAAQSAGVESLSPACVSALLPEVELRLREVVQDALKFQTHARRAQLSASDVNRALQTRGLEALYGFQASGTARYRRSEDAPGLYLAEDEELEAAELLNAPLGQIPMHPVLNLHWLAVDGVQPTIPENESAADDSSCRTSIRDESFVGNVDRRPLVKHVLTDEMQLYYATVTDAVKGGDAALQRAAFASLARDPGIHQLLPYLSRFVYEEVKHSNRDLRLLCALMRTCRCLLANQNLRVELYMHQLIPAILTCVLGSQLCENPADDHWGLRKYAARLVAQICERFGDTYANIPARVSKTFHKAITDPACPFSTQYGALHGMMYMGPLVLESLLFPSLKQYCHRLEPALASSNPNLVERLEAQNCLGILVHASGSYFAMSKELRTGASTAVPEAALGDIMSLLYEAFGESLVPYIRPDEPVGMVELCL